MTEPLYKRIQTELKGRILSGELAAGERMLSEKELAGQFGVSLITIKNALNGLVEEGLLVRYRGKGTYVSFPPAPGTSGQAKPIAGSRTIAYIVPTMKTRVDQRLLDGIERYCAEAGYDLLIRITRESQEEESRAIEQFRQRGVDGFIIFPVERESYNASILRLTLDKVPLVLIDRFMKEIRTYSVSSDNIGGVKEAVADLIDRGHRRIAYLTPIISNSVTIDRAIGYEAAHTEKGLPIHKRLWCTLSFDTIANGLAREEISKFLAVNEDITAVFAVNAELARNAYDAIRLKAKKDKSAQPELVSFDDPGLEGIAHVKQNEEEMSRQTVELLAEQLNGTHHPRRIVVPVEYVKTH